MAARSAEAGRLAGWVLGTSLAVVAVDVLTSELVRLVRDADLAVALDTLDLAANFVLFGWAGYRVARARQTFRAGLEAAVLAGLLVGLFALAYHVVRPVAPFVGSHAVQLLAWNVIYAALGGVVGAWLGWRAALRPPD
jgi:hypothetical protein